MNDALKYPSRDLKLKLDWPSDQPHMADEQCVVVELQYGDGITLASLSLPIQQLLQAVSQKLNCYPLLSLDGIVSIVLDDAALGLPENQKITIDRLIAEGISSDMLDDELDAANMLSELRTRLLKSLELVEQAITSLPKD
jgi:hypothetical protein